MNDGELFSAPDTVIINAYVTNHAPSAEAGSDINLYLGYIAPLDGNGSSDPDGDQLIFVWTITSAPPGSISILSDPNIANPTFMPDVIGTYTFTLIVNDGELFSAPDTVTITVPNRAPTAEAGADINLSLGSVTSLNGNGSYDPDGDPLTFVWTITSAPPGSMAALSNSTIINPTFQPDVIGTYTITLIVSDGTLSSAADTLTITVSGS